MSETFFDPPLEMYIQESTRQTLLLAEDVDNINKSENTTSSNQTSLFSSNSKTNRTSKDT